jgi:hypothetical protein
MNDQFALALLRMQHGLDQTNTRLAKLEELVRQSLDGLRLLQNQTHAKQRFDTGEPSTSGRKPLVGNCRNRLISFVRHLGLVHWFYLSYPIVVYMILKSLERRRRNHRPSW